MTSPPVESHRDETLAVHPCEISDVYVVKKQSVLNGAVIVEDVVTPPNEHEISALTHHCLVVHLSDDSTRQVNRFDGKEYDGPIPNGYMFLAPAEVPVLWSWETTDQGMVFAFDSAPLQKAVLEMDSLNPDRVELRIIPLAHDPQIEAIARSFKHEMESPEIASSLYMGSLANLLIVRLLRNHCVFKPKVKTYTDGLSKQKLQLAIAYIQDHLSEDISLAEIAAYLGISQYYFCRLFKQSTGITPHRYLLQKRVERAKELLRQRDGLSLLEVASLSGFADQSHLTTQFRKSTGMTPKSYRNSF